MFSTGETSRDLGGDYFARRDPQRATRRLVAQLERLGHSVDRATSRRRVGPTGFSSWWTSFRSLSSEAKAR